MTSQVNFKEDSLLLHSFSILLLYNIAIGFFFNCLQEKESFYILF